jgi:hypothetical protein
VWGGSAGGARTGRTWHGMWIGRSKLHARSVNVVAVKRGAVNAAIGADLQAKLPPAPARAYRLLLLQLLPYCVPHMHCGIHIPASTMNTSLSTYGKLLPPRPPRRRHADCNNAG